MVECPTHVRVLPTMLVDVDDDGVPFMTSFFDDRVNRMVPERTNSQAMRYGTAHNQIMVQPLSIQDSDDRTHLNVVILTNQWLERFEPFGTPGTGIVKYDKYYLDRFLRAYYHRMDDRTDIRRRYYSPLSYYSVPSPPNDMSSTLSYINEYIRYRTHAINKPRTTVLQEWVSCY